MSETIANNNQSKWMTYENGILLLLGFTFGLIFFDRNAINFLAPYFMEDLGINNTQLGLLNSALALSWALSAYFVSAMSDQSGVRKPFLLLSVVTFSVCSAIGGLASTFAFLILARIVMGIAEGPFLPICFSIMNAESSPHRRGFNAGFMQNVFAALLGTTLAPLIMVAIAEAYDWQAAFYLTGIPGLICAFLIWKFLREPKIVETAETHQLNKPGIVASLQMLSIHNVLICSLVSICMVAWFLITFSFQPVFLTQYRGFSEGQMSVVTSVMGICTVLCGFLVPALSDRIGRKPVMVFFCFMGVITPLAALYFNGPLWMLGMLMFIGWSATGAFPIFMGVIPAESVSPLMAASSMGLIVSIGELVGGVGGPAIAGRLADMYSLQYPMYIIAGLAFTGGVLSLFLKETAPSIIASQTD